MIYAKSSDDYLINWQFKKDVAIPYLSLGDDFVIVRLEDLKKLRYKKKVK